MIMVDMYIDKYEIVRKAIYFNFSIIIYINVTDVIQKPFET